MTVMQEPGRDPGQGCRSSELQEYCFVPIPVALPAPSQRQELNLSVQEPNNMKLVT